MKTLGVDLHKDSLTVAVLGEEGQLLERQTLPTKCRNRIQEYFASYGQDSQVAVESVGFYQWFWDLLRPVCGSLHLADPAGVRAHAGRQAKTDPHDALLLATLLHDGRLPCAFVPEESLRQLRELVRLRHSLARSLAAERRQMRWISLKLNLPGPSTLSSERAQKWLLAQEDKFPAPLRTAARLRLDHIVALERNVADLERLLRDMLRQQPRLQRQVDFMESVPGVGFLTAVTVVAETGGITRFANIDQLSAYAGLAPKVSQSGETVHHGHISKQGPPILRWCLQQAAWVAIRTDPQARRIWYRISRRAGPKKAATALARRLLAYCWSVCRRNRPFQWPQTVTPPTQSNPLDLSRKGVWCYEI